MSSLWDGFIHADCWGHLVNGDNRALCVRITQLQQKRSHIIHWLHPVKAVVISPEDAHIINGNAFEIAARNLTKKSHDVTTRNPNSIKVTANTPQSAGFTATVDAQSITVEFVPSMCQTVGALRVTPKHTLKGDLGSRQLGEHTESLLRILPCHWLLLPSDSWLKKSFWLFVVTVNLTDKPRGHVVLGFYSLFLVKEAAAGILFFKKVLKNFCTILTFRIQLSTFGNVPNLFFRQKDAVTNEERIASHRFSNVSALGVFKLLPLLSSEKRRAHFGNLVDLRSGMILMIRIANAPFD
jgi:hypothetical protein